MKSIKALLLGLSLILCCADFYIHDIHGNNDVEMIKEKIRERYDPTPDRCRAAINPDVETIPDMDNDLACVVLGYKPIYGGQEASFDSMDQLFKMLYGKEIFLLIFEITGEFRFAIYRKNTEQNALLLQKLIVERETGKSIGSYAVGVLLGYREKDILYYNQRREFLIFMATELGLDWEEMAYATLKPLAFWDQNIRKNFEEFIKKNPIPSEYAKEKKGDSLWLDENRKKSIEQLKREIKELESKVKEKESASERTERERLLQEQREQEEQLRKEAERLEQERLERERKEKERLEQQRIEQERREREEREQKEKERLERERLEKERQERLLQEQKQREQEEREQLRKETERLERERLERERKEKERLEQQRIERERREREEREKLERERQRLLQEQKEREEQERKERERLEQQKPVDLKTLATSLHALRTSLESLAMMIPRVK
jgi:DNA repair exonuclease SbcCD ATPase subunit